MQMHIVTMSVRGVALARVATGVIDDTETLVASMRKHAPSFTAERFASAKELTRGKHNVIRLAEVEPHESPFVIRLATVYDPPEEFAKEMEYAVSAWERGVGLEPLYFGLRIIDGEARGVSCWPVATGAYAYLRALKPSERPAFGHQVVAAITKCALECPLMPLDAASLSNFVVTADGRVMLIDFDTYYTKRPRNQTQRSATEGFVAVATVILACATCSNTFSIAQIAALVGTGHDVRAVADAVSARCSAVCDAFIDVEVVLMRILHAYVCFSVARRKKPRSSAFDRIAAIGRSDDLGHFELVASGHKTAAYTAAFVRLALDAAFEPDFGSRLDAFVAEFESISPPRAKKNVNRKRKRAVSDTGECQHSDESGAPSDAPSADSEPSSQEDAGIELECTSD
jgi:hypothetical protein